MFSLRAVSKAFGGQTALFPTTFDVPVGLTTVLIGPSGCGKSTLLRLMSGLIDPDAGMLTFDGEPLTAAALPRVRRRMGYVIQDGGLFPHLTGRQNVTLQPEYLRCSPAQVRARVDELLQLTRLPADALDRFPLEMSGGQRQRVALMRALAMDPDVLLLDEPLGALDPMVRFDLQNDLQAIFRHRQKTTVLVTHDLAEAAFFADLLVVMKDGAIVQQGTADDVLNRPADAFVQRFVAAQRLPLAKRGGDQ